MGIKGLDEICIYALVDPVQGIPRYVGQTESPEQRYKNHLSVKATRGESARAVWVRKLQQQGRRPFMVILDCVPRAESKVTEKKWIAHFLGLGVRLYNEKIK